MTLQILIHNVGHGQSVHAFTPVGQRIVIDLGGHNSFSPLQWLRNPPISVIDLLVITHPHGDHIDEILELDNFDFWVKQLWCPKWLIAEEVRRANLISYQEKVERYLFMSNHYTEEMREEERVGNPNISGGVKIQIFSSSSCSRSNINNHSGVVVFEHLGVKVVIPGDNESPSWRQLLENRDFTNAISGTYIFMASHHGRESGYCKDLFNIFKPKLCVVSDGRVQDTDAAGRYSYHATGWKVYYRRGGSEDRYCLTTRSDGYVDIKIGGSQEKPFLSVTTG